MRRFARKQEALDSIAEDWQYEVFKSGMSNLKSQAKLKNMQ